MKLDDGEAKGILQRESECGGVVKRPSLVLGLINFVSFETNPKLGETFQFRGTSYFVIIIFFERYLHI